MEIDKTYMLNKNFQKNDKICAAGCPREDRPQWTFINSGFCDCRSNMAIDEAMLKDYTAGKTGPGPSDLKLEFNSARTGPIFRIYGWRPYAFSIGYSQEPEEVLDLAKCKEKNIPYVKRITGGGVIFHADELTYSLVCSPSDIGAPNLVKEAFKTTCTFLLNAYKKLGLDANFSFKEVPWQSAGGFCFASREKYDIVINGKKIGGNAQKRLKDVIFQHGSIPLALNTKEALYFLREKPKDVSNFISLREALKREVTFEELKEIMKESFEETFQAKLIEDSNAKAARVA